MDGSDRSLMAPESIYSSEQAGGKKNKMQTDLKRTQAAILWGKKALCGF